MAFFRTFQSTISNNHGFSKLHRYQPSKPSVQKKHALFCASQVYSRKLGAWSSKPSSVRARSPNPPKYLENYHTFAYFDPQQYGESSLPLATRCQLEPASVSTHQAAVAGASRSTAKVPLFPRSPSQQRDLPLESNHSDGGKEWAQPQIPPE